VRVSRTRWLGEGAALLLVAFAYVFFATNGTLRFPEPPAQPRGWDNPGGGYYAQQAQGFLRGTTALPVAPDPKFASILDPYDYGQREQAGISYLWDASYYRGQYHLYFTPIPVALVYLPWRLITGLDADDSYAALVFALWTFLAAAFAIRRAVPAGQRALWLVFAGLANLLPFALSNVRVYEVAILCATAFSASWAAALLRFEEHPGIRNAIWMGVWLGLAIAARPNLGVLLVPTAVILWRQTPALRLHAGLAAFLPIALAGCGYAGFNYARFGNVMESGISYQLTYVSMRGLSRCSLCTLPEVFRFANNALQYQFAPPRLSGDFPHAALPSAFLDPRTSWPGGTPEEILGIVAHVPLTLVATILGMLFLASRRKLESRTWTGISVLGGAWLVLFTLSTCWWIVSRYAFDFQILMLVGTILCLQQLPAMAESWGISFKPLRIGIAALAVYSILLGVLLGFEGREGEFRVKNPTLTQRIAKTLGVAAR
jgi:hypothetical protein